VAGVHRLPRGAAALDLLVPAALFLWIPTGVMGLIGQALLAAGVFLPYLPHVSLGWFLANHFSALDIALRLTLSYGWSLALAWVFVRAAMRVPGGDRPPFLSPRKAGGLLAGVWALSLGAGIFGVVRHYDDLRPLSRGDPAPAVLGVDLADGHRVAPADFADTPVVVQFWATWCPVCVHSMPELIEWARLHPRVKVLAVHVGAPRQEVSDFVREKGWKGIDFLADEGGEAASVWRVDSYPTVVTLGRGGRIAGIRIGEASGDWLDAHLSAEPPPPQVEYSR
jgi:thiol-disulfide isomerase/thioredoxin